MTQTSVSVSLDPVVFYVNVGHVSDVDEKGTEAAAASAMAIVAYCSLNMEEPPPPIYFTADHPFMFAIRHQETGMILFFGRVEKL